MPRTFGKFGPLDVPSDNERKLAEFLQAAGIGGKAVARRGMSAASDFGEAARLGVQAGERDIPASGEFDTLLTGLRGAGQAIGEGLGIGGLTDEEERALRQWNIGQAPLPPEDFSAYPQAAAGPPIDISPAKTTPEETAEGEKEGERVAALKERAASGQKMARSLQERIARLSPAQRREFEAQSALDAAGTSATRPLQEGEQHELLADTLRGNRPVVDRDREARMRAAQTADPAPKTLAELDAERRKDIMLQEGLANLGQGLWGLAGAPIPEESAVSPERDMVLPSEREFLSKQLGMDIPEGMSFSRLHASYPALAQAVRARSVDAKGHLLSEADRKDVLWNVRQGLLKRSDLKDIREMHSKGGTVQSLLKIGGGQAAKAVMTSMAKLAGDTGRLSDQDIQRWSERMGVQGGWDKIVKLFASRPSEAWTKEMKEVARELTEKHAQAYNDLIRSEIEALTELRGIPQAEAEGALSGIMLPVSEETKARPKTASFRLPDGTTGIIGETVITLPDGKKGIVTNYNPITEEIDFEYQ